MIDTDSLKITRRTSGTKEMLEIFDVAREGGEGCYCKENNVSLNSTTKNGAERNGV